MSGPVGAVTPNNDAYGGGGLFRSAPPTSGPTGALPGPNTSSLAAGVNPQSAPFYARPNEGTNIRIPYGRVTPLADPRATGLPDVSGRKASTPTSLMSPTDYRASMHGDALIKPYMSETDTLRPSRLAFILAKKSVHGPGPMLGRNPVTLTEQGLREDESDTATANARDFSYAINSTIAPSLPGTQRLQKLCSFEYAQRYVDVACNLGQVPLVLEVSAATIQRDAEYADNEKVNLLHAKNVAKWYKESASYGGRLNSIVASALARAQTFADNTADQNSVARHLKNNGVEYTTPTANVKDAIDKLRAADAAFIDKFKDGSNEAVLNEAIAKSTDHDPLVMSGMPSAVATLGSMDNMGMMASEVDSQANPLFASPMARGDNSNLPMRPVQYQKLLPTSDGLNGATTKVFAAKKRQYGIFTCDEGPFLRGHAAIGSNELTAHGLLNSQRDPRNILRGVPARVCTAEGDIVAFSILESQLSAKGLFDWTPDGMCLSKFSNVPDDVLEDQRIDARDGVLYNVAIQGPAIATNWTGSPHLAVLPSDRVFIVIVADAISVEDDLMLAVLTAHKDGSELDATATTIAGDKKRKLALMLGYMFKLNTKADASERISTRQEFAQLRENYMRDDVLTAKPPSYGAWEKSAADVAAGTVKKNVILHNYRLEVATSSQMANYSGLRFENGGDQKQHEFSRMGLKLGSTISEYIVGGWCIGSVMDSAASRAAMPDGMSIGPRTAPNTAAINLYVDIEYWSGDKLYRKYANVAGDKRGLIRARFEPPEMDSTKQNSVDQPQALQNLPSTVDLATPAGADISSAGIAETFGNRPEILNQSQPIMQALVEAQKSAEDAEKLAATYAGEADPTKQAEIAAEVKKLAQVTEEKAQTVIKEYNEVGADPDVPTTPTWLENAKKDADAAVVKAKAAAATVP